MVRQKSKQSSVAGVVLSSARDVDRAIRAVADLEAQAGRVKGEAEDEIRAIRESAAARETKTLEAAEALRGCIEEWAEAHAEEFGKARSLALSHGRIGWRRVPRVKFLVKAATLVAALEGRGLADAVIVKKTPNKEVLATYPKHVLDDVGARIVVDEKFYIEPAKETPPRAEPGK